jgi:Asp-tRNA(Asn)/Glu-tRNA(Gln) amidotransferase B subunit
VLGLVAFFKQPMDTFQNHCIFRRREVAGVCTVDLETMQFWVVDTLLAEINADGLTVLAIAFVQNIADFLAVCRKPQMQGKGAKMVCVDHMVFRIDGAFSLN